MICLIVENISYEEEILDIFIKSIMKREKVYEQKERKVLLKQVFI